MEYTNKIIEILKNYENTNAGIKANLGRILMHGDLGGTGKLVILPVDQGHEHGPDKSFLVNPPAYDPEYHYKLASRNRHEVESLERMLREDNKVHSLDVRYN